jgi:hypothetical protein
MLLLNIAPRFSKANLKSLEDQIQRQEKSHFGKNNKYLHIIDSFSLLYSLSRLGELFVFVRDFFFHLPE